MISVVADVFEVVVFATCTDALLGISGTGRIIGRFLGAEEVGHELIHPRVREEQIRGSGHQRSRGHGGVPFGSKEIEEGLADLGGGHGIKVLS